MRDVPIGNIIRAVRTVGPQDTIGRAAEALRVSGLAELPVVAGARVVGIVTEAMVLEALTSGDPKTAIEQPVATIFSDQVVSINPYMSVGQVAEIMSHHDVQVVPIVDDYGGYLGVVTRQDIAGALCLTMRPPAIAGLATPLGVYLTTGHLRAGVGDLGLFLAGVGLIAVYFVAFWAIFGAAYLVDKTNLFAPWSLWSILVSPPIGVYNWMDAVKSVMLGLALPIFLLLLRLLPTAGYHAAEHQVVHAIENGEPLKLENVRAMPRVHPRCGTNIFAGVLLFMIIRQILSEAIAIVATVLVLMFGWRVIGGYLQHYVTTKPASAKQLESGIRAGESLLEKYRSNPSYRVTGWQRIWNTGMVQVLIGAAAVAAVIQNLHLTPPGFF
ncbi:MAG TPA: DUF1385 domain-containing protein [Armatimonadota bacterium]|nr:DUF1385 domain-containing protein [Armatimonadota bacterium]